MKAKKICVAAVVMVIVAGLDLFAGEVARPEVMWRLSGFLPGDVENWHTASQLDVQARFWGAGDLGVALSMGIGSWQAVSEFIEEDDGSGYMATSVYGNLTTLPVGISALYRFDVARGVSVVIEGGVRYVLAQSNIRTEITYDDGVDSGYLRGTVLVDDAFVGVAGISVQSAVAPGVVVECGMGYQFDLLEPHEIFMGEDIGATSLSAAAITIGCSWEF